MEENKNLYETIIILKGNFNKEEYKKAFEQIKEYFTKYEVKNIEELGKKKLAYEIRKNKEGYFIIIQFEAFPKDTLEIERYYRINDDVIKYMTLKVDETSNW